MPRVRTKLLSLLRGTLRRRVVTRTALWVLMGISVSVLGAGLLHLEYRTNGLARRAGNILADMNAVRNLPEAFRQQGPTHIEVRESLGRPGENPQPGLGMPRSIDIGVYRMRRVPETGPPTYLALWHEVTPAAKRESRPVHDVVESLRIYELAIGLLQAAHVPDLRYRSAVRRHVARLLRELTDPAPGSTPGSASEDAHSVPPVDSLRASVTEELERDLIDRYRSEERAALLADLSEGRIHQILLHRSLGAYRGQLSYHDRSRPDLTFELAQSPFFRALNGTDSETAHEPF